MGRERERESVSVMNCVVVLGSPSKAFPTHFGQFSQGGEEKREKNNLRQLSSCESLFSFFLLFFCSFFPPFDYCLWFGFSCDVACVMQELVSSLFFPYAP